MFNKLRRKALLALMTDSEKTALTNLRTSVEHSIWYDSAWSDIESELKTRACDMTAVHEEHLEIIDRNRQDVLDKALEVANRFSIRFIPR